MNELLKKIKDIYSEPCVSILLNTHRSRPANQKDSITLKNLQKEAENRLYETYDKRLVLQITDKLSKCIEQINHDQNIESLILFANKDFADYTRLAISVKERVIIDNTFATRDLVRALHQEAAYYVLVLSRQSAKLIEAFNNKCVNENIDGFPIINNLYTTDRLKLSTNKGQDVLIEEYFNKVDKVLNTVRKNNPLPVVIVTEKRNYSHYLQVADNESMVIAHLNKNRDNDKALQIVEDAWEEVKRHLKKLNEKRISELHVAASKQKLLTDYNDIWTAIKEGRGKTLVVRKGFYQAAKIDNNKILVVDEIQVGDKNIIDDVIDEMIELNLSYGGDTVFVDEKAEIENFTNISLICRY